ncbi:hypothetical protein ACIQNU_41680 [Streptomyces sp. NPDC091292]|uniref:hypothetical protein n=1 Tax=Streptomyces sp. NPDC091292 TaxID=3365991 RepID=UPI00380EAC2C
MHRFPRIGSTRRAVTGVYPRLRGHGATTGLLTALLILVPLAGEAPAHASGPLARAERPAPGPGPAATPVPERSRAGTGPAEGRERPGRPDPSPADDTDAGSDTGDSDTGTLPLPWATPTPQSPPSPLSPSATTSTTAEPPAPPAPSVHIDPVVDNAPQGARAPVVQPYGRYFRILPLGAGLVLMGLGLAFLAVRLRRD